MKKSTRILILVFTVFLVVFISGCGNDTTESSGDGGTGETMTLKISSAWAENSATTEGGKYFSELIYEATDGKYDARVYPSDQLASGNQLSAIEMLQNGDVELDFRGITLLSSMDERFTVVNMPFLLPTYEDVENVFINGEGAVALNEVVEDVGLVPLGYGCGGYRQILNTKVDIRTPEDIQGLKMRVVSSPMLFSYWDALGANTTSINMSEVYTALQQNVIDGQENGIDTAESYNIFEVTDYVTVWNGVYDAFIFQASPSFWNTLSDEEKEIFQDCAKEAMEYQRELARENEVEILEEHAENVTVTYLNEEEMEAFEEVAEPIYDEYYDIIGGDLLEAFGYTR